MGGNNYGAQFNIRDFSTVTVTRGAISTGYVYNSKISEGGLPTGYIKTFSLSENATINLSEYGDRAFYITGDCTVKLSSF